ncbi:MAG: uncharacterized protein QOH06_5068 [Acidobacteriota bacterium]|jgi:uncharacterized DUF497 family protein|nr:uncharacterized protein [Acidobacteriota bacterium]
METQDEEGSEFDWDGGNAEKNWERHQVSQSECEQVFFNRPLVVGDDDLHSVIEARHFVLGRTDAGRLLFLVYTLREERIRVISARDMTRREIKEYQRAKFEEDENDPEV